MKKYILPATIIVLIVASVLYLNLRPQSQASLSTVAKETPSATPSTSPTSSPAAGTPAGAYKDGQYTGSAADSRYGTVQVKATVSGGKLTDVTLLQMPSEQGHTAEVSNTAGPQLRQEALTAQSANVDIISGATQTSEGFQQSLSSALSQAKV